MGSDRRTLAIQAGTQLRGHSGALALEGQNGDSGQKNRMASRTRGARPGLHAGRYSQLADAANSAGCIETGEADPDGQTLLVSYPEVEPRECAASRTSRTRREVGSRSQPICHNPPVHQ
jgi:hypothetical protein